VSGYHTISCTQSLFAGRSKLSVSSIPLYLVGAACAQWKIGGSIDKVADQNVSFYFYWADYTLNKTFPLFFYFRLIFHWTNYTFNKTSHYFFTFPLFFARQTTPLTKFFFCIFFTFAPSHFLICTLNKTPPFYYFYFSLGELHP